MIGYYMTKKKHRNILLPAVKSMLLGIMILLIMFSLKVYHNSLSLSIHIFKNKIIGKLLNLAWKGELNYDLNRYEIKSPLYEKRI